MVNPYVEAPASPSATSGTGLIDDVVVLSQDIANENWVSAGLMGAATVVDLAATISDPLGSLISWGFGWLLDHFEPLKGWLNDLTGDPYAVEGFAGTYENISTGLKEESTYLLNRLQSDLDGQTAQALAAYREFMRTYGQGLDALGDAAGACATGLRIAATFVEIVHNVVRDVISQIVGSITSYLTEFALTLGAATPLIIEQVSTRVASMATKVGTTVRELVNSVEALKSLISQLDEAVGALRSLLGRINPGAARGRHTKPWLDDPAPRVPSGGPHGRRAKAPGDRDVPGEMADRAKPELPRDAVPGTASGAAGDTREAEDG